MDQDNNESEIVKELKEVLKPSPILPIWNTIICSGPPLNLIFRYFVERDIKDPTIAIILTIISIIVTVFSWYWYLKERKDFKKNWDEISLELETIDYNEKPTKDYIDKIFYVLQITAIVSIVAVIISLAITIMFKIAFLEYFALFSLLIFLLSGIGIMLIGIKYIFSFIKYLKEEKRLINVLKRFLLIFTIIFIIQMIRIFILHQNINWVERLLFSFMMTFPIIFYIEISIAYKKIKADLSMVTETDESDDN